MPPYVAMPDEPSRVFLSYGVRDASEIAERLRCDLAARGYDVWQDVKRLRAGRPWDEDVPEGLRNSQVVLALLSPQSVRRAMDAGNPTASDSVCLDEIAYARGARKIPIVPVQVISCEAPFLIYRLHQIDFRRWAESEATYQAGLGQICAGIEAALRGETPERSWRPLLEPWDFAPFLLEKRNHFTGRKWLFRELDEWRRKEAPPALLITGEPGIGKSAIVAALVHENPEGQVLAYHCCRADTPATLEPARFVRTLAGMLAARLEGYAEMLEDPGIKGALERADGDPASAFEAVILSPLHNLSPLHSVPKTVGDRRYLLIDALDEALMNPKRPTIVEVLATRINRLPSWLGIVATTRSEPGVLSQLRGLPAEALKADDPKNQDDVQAFLHDRLRQPSLRNKVEASGKRFEELATSLLRSSAGNFLFVTTAIDAVEGGQLRFDDVENQPPGRLSSLYEMFFNRLFRDTGMEFQAAGQVLEVVAAAREPLTRKQIAAVSGLDAEKELPLLLGRLAAFVPIREGSYSLFHRSLFEWLTGWDTQQDQSFAGPYHVSLQEGHKRLANWGWAEYERGVQHTSLYCFRHLLAHLHEVDRNDRARTVLLDFNWLQAKLISTDINALIADYDFLPEDKDLRLVQSVIRLSAHILVRDPRQLAGQLTGRLLGNEVSSVRALLKDAAQRKAWTWFRPLNRILTAPGGPLIRTLEGHRGSVNAVAVMPDGRCAVSASNDRTLRLWDLKSGQCLRTLEDHTGSVFTVAIMPDGRRALSSSSDNTLRFWDLESGQSLRTLQGHSSWVRGVAITADGRRAVSAADDTTLRLWDLESGQTIRTLRGHTVSVMAVAVTPDGRRAVSASADQTLRVWDLESGQTIRTLQGHTMSVWAVAVTPDGRCAVSASVDETLRVWDLESGQTIRTLQGHMMSVWAVTVTPDGRHIVSGSADTSLRVWDLESGQVLLASKGHTKSVWAVAVTPDGRRAVSASEDQTLRLWDLESGQTICTLKSHTMSVWAVAVTPDGRCAVSASEDATLRLWDLESGQTIRTLQGHTISVNSVAVTPDGQRAVSASVDGTLRVWDLESGQTIRTLEGHTKSVWAVAVTPDGCRAVSASGDRTLRLWDLESHRPVHIFEGHTDTVYAVAVTPDGHRAVSASRDKTLRVWDLESGKTIHTLQGHKDYVRAVAITPDGRRAVSASEDQTLRLWDLESGQTIRTLEGHTLSVNSVVVTPDGRRAVSASEDQTLRLWDLESGKGIAAFTADSLMNSCTFARDGRTIVAGDASGQVHFLRLVEADETEPSPAEIKVPPLLRQQQSTDKPKEGVR
jgi:WD40 repeat protein